MAYYDVHVHYYVYNIVTPYVWHTFYTDPMQGIPFLICLLFLEIHVRTVLKAKLVVCIISACVSQYSYKLIYNFIV